MEYIVSYNTDKGIRKSLNEDALLMKVDNTKEGRVALFAVADGMGGLKQGDVASSTVIRGINSWYEEELLKMLGEPHENIVDSLYEKINQLNEKILNYSRENNVTLGTTLTALLCLDNKYYILHVGDSRVYKIKDNFEILTEDQTFVAREVKRGNITKDEAKIHPRRNVLLQCIGALENIEILSYEGVLESDTMFMLCSDGLHHELSDEEIIKFFNPLSNSTKDVMDSNAINIVELVKARGEKDNITILLIRVL